MRPKEKLNNALIDWRKPNNFLARQYGVSGEAIRQRRVQAGAPAPLFKSRSDTGRFYSVILDRLEEIRGLPKRDAERILGFPLPQGKVRIFAFQHAALNRGKRPWGRMNFNLPSGVLASLWRIPIQSVHKQRLEWARGGPKWKAIRNRKQVKEEAFRAAEAAEEIVARSYFREHPPAESEAPKSSALARRPVTGT